MKLLKIKVIFKRKKNNRYEKNKAGNIISNK
jgi:hypothetical protein